MCNYQDLVLRTASPAMMRACEEPVPSYQSPCATGDDDEEGLWPCGCCSGCCDSLIEHVRTNYAAEYAADRGIHS